MFTIYYSEARKNLKQLCDQVAAKDETAIITRRDNEDVVLISMERYSRLMRLIEQKLSQVNVESLEQEA